MDLLEEGELEQYQRHLSLQGFGQTCQSSLKNSSVLVVGAGGLGCPALQYLTAAGVGKIGIIDDDVVEISNLQRQVLFDHADQGMLKAEVAANKLRKLNPYISINSYCERLTSKNCESIFKKYDLILDGTDNFSTRYLINDASVLFQRPLIHGSIHQFEGMVTVFNLNNKGPTYRCLFPEQPDPTSIPTCADAGVLGVLPGVIGCWQALEAIKVLSNIGEPLWRKILLFNALTQSVRTIHFDPVPENLKICLLYTSPSPRDLSTSRMPSSA